MRFKISASILGAVNTDKFATLSYKYYNQLGLQQSAIGCEKKSEATAESANYNTISKADKIFTNNL
ncbi:MAG: hypothetical protein PUP90_16690 [Nostoc sp. S4]|nr:hypothetical protein [Nostoc sp. S4]